MTIEDVERYFGSGYRFAKESSYSHSTYYMWKKRKRIPLIAQLRIQELTNNALKADMEELKRM